MGTPAPFPIIVCEHRVGKWMVCGYSFFVSEIDAQFPTFCRGCQKKGKWRPTLPGEYTSSDLAFLRRLRIAVDAVEGV